MYGWNYYMCVTLLIISNLWRSNECSQAASYVHPLFLFLMFCCTNRYFFRPPFRHTHSLIIEYVMISLIPWVFLRICQYLFFTILFPQLSLYDLAIHLLFPSTVHLHFSASFQYVPLTLTLLPCPHCVLSVPAGMKVLNVVSLTDTHTYAHLHTLYPRARTNTRNQFSIYRRVGNLPAHSKHYLPPILRDKGLTAAGVFANLCLSMCACLCISRKQWGRRS